MAERRGTRDQTQDDLPVYLARPGTADQVPRQKHGGLFCSVEDAFESKTLDFDALSVGQRGSRTRETRPGAASCRSGSPGAGGPPDGQGRRESGEEGVQEVTQSLAGEKVRGGWGGGGSTHRQPACTDDER